MEILLFGGVSERGGDHQQGSAPLSTLSTLVAAFCISNELSCLSTCQILGASPVSFGHIVGVPASANLSRLWAAHRPNGPKLERFRPANVGPVSPNWAEFSKYGACSTGIAPKLGNLSLEWSSCRADALEERPLHANEWTKLRRRRRTN